MDRNLHRAFARGVGRRLRAARAFRDLDVDAVAALAGIAARRLRDYEAGRGRVTAGELERLSAVLNVPVMQFFGPCTLCGRDL